MFKPEITDLMRALDDLEEVKGCLFDVMALTEDGMEAERLFVRALAVLHSHMRFLQALG